MGRLFNEHITRRVHSLDGAWKFRKDQDNQGVENQWYLEIPQAEMVAIPSVWNTEKGNLTYEGVAWYEKSFYSEGGCLRFCFGAVMTEAQVWLDGKSIGSHYGGFSQFDFIVPNVDKGQHRLTIRVDNHFDAQSIPQVHVDWYHYGGVPRSVTVETLEGVCVLSNRLEYELSDDLCDVKAKFVLELYNADNQKQTTDVTVKLGDELTQTAVAMVDGNSYATLTLPSFELHNVKLWDVFTPNLYPIVIETATDDLYDRVGFRKIEVKDRELVLNGKPLEIRGVNRHEEHPDWGFAFPLNLMRRDIDHILDLGCNSIRGSHYPNSQEFVDMLDEYGIVFWSEIPIWGVGFPEQALADPVVVERGLQMHREMVKYYYNHPCIILWGMHNEILSRRQAAYDMSKIYYEYLKENGGNRLVVFASHDPWQDICFEFSDIICPNQYYGWYYGYEEDAWEQFLEKFCERLESLGMQDKPIIVSEFGCAALFGCHDDDHILWSEEYQAKLLTHCLELFHEHPAVVGGYIWQFSDIRTCLQAGINRARGFNNKGIMNEYRKPKLAYHAVRKCYHAFAEEAKADQGNESK